MELEQLKAFEGQLVDGVYRLGELIGRGGFGGVFRADHIVDGRHIRSVAIKLTVPAEEDPERQFGEMIVGTTLQHDHLLPCFHAGSTELVGSRLLFQVMELADHSLSARLKQGALAADEILDLMEQVFTALAWLHDERKHIHRDVKPGNILQVKGRWKLADFGTARASASSGTSQTDVIAGSRLYMPPEGNLGLVSTGFDMWSASVVILEVFAGKRLEPDDILAIQRNEPGALPNLPEPYQLIVSGCLTDRKRMPARRALEILRGHRALIQERERVRCLEQMQRLKGQVRRELEAGRWEMARAALQQAQSVNTSDPDLPGLETEIRRGQEKEADFQRRVISAVTSGNYFRAYELLGEHVEPIVEPVPSAPLSTRAAWVRRWLPMGLVAIAVSIATLVWQTGSSERRGARYGTYSGVGSTPSGGGQLGSDGSPIALQNAVPDQRASATPVHYRVTIPPLTSLLSVVLTPVSNDADLDLYYAAMPAPGVNGKPDCQRFHTGLNEERCIIYSPSPGNWYIRVKPGGRTEATVRIVAAYESKAIPLQKDVPVRLNSSSSLDYRITIPPAAGELRVTLTQMPSEVTFDLSHWDGQQSLVKEQPACSRPDARTLVCSVPNPAAGDSFIHLKQAGDKLTVATLLASYQ